MFVFATVVEFGGRIIPEALHGERITPVLTGVVWSPGGRLMRCHVVVVVVALFGVSAHRRYVVVKQAELGHSK